MLLQHILITIVCCVLLTLSSGGAELCIKDGTTEHCYQIVDANITWNEAFNICKHDSSMLIIIDSPYEQNVIADQMKKRKFTVNGLWIGSNNLHPEAQRTWANGNKFTYQNWAIGEPSGTHAESDENCVEISTTNTKWNDISCSDKRGYICEKTQGDCYKETTTYNGQKSVTISGRICQAWSLNTPHSHTYHKDSLFPDGKEDTAVNFCRDPSREGLLWCYTVDRAKRWEECPIWSCEEIGANEPCMRDEISGHCYQILDTKITWNQAFYWCKRAGGNLVTIESIEEQQFIADLMLKKIFKASGLWIGSNKLHPEEQRTWVNGEQFSYVNWAKGEPNGPSFYENCAELRIHDSTWNDLQCTELRGYICENSHAARKYMQDNATGLWYKIVDTQVTWAKALNICMSNGGILMVIETAEEQKFIDDQIQMMNRTFTARGLWIGANKLHLEKKRKWINGTQFTYSNWAEGEPYNTLYVENCAEMYTSDSTWNDEDCYSLRGYICEKTPPVTPDSSKSQVQVFFISIAVGSSLVLLVVILLIYCLIQKRTKCKKNNEGHQDVQDTEMYQAEQVFYERSDLDDKNFIINDHV